MAANARCRLVFVGENDGGQYGTAMKQAIHDSGRAERVRITGRATLDDFRKYLGAADVAVQLRTLTRGETSGAALDCMAHGVATIVNAHGSMAYLPGDCVVTVPDEFTGEDLSGALERLWQDGPARARLGDLARQRIRTHHAPRRIAEEYFSAIEHFSDHAPVSRRVQVTHAVGALEGGPAAAQEWLGLAQAIATNHPADEPARQLLVDVSVLVQQDAKSGIQRVVRGVLDKLLSEPPAGYRVEPVYGTPWAPYRYARRFTLRLLGCPEDALDDDVVLTRPGDLFLGLDLVPLWVPQKKSWFQSLRDRGVKVLFVVYDLLPVARKDCFPQGAFEQHSNWLQTVAEHADGAVCISRAVADELTQWLNARKIARRRPFRIGWFHLGADAGPSAQTQGVSPEFLRDLEKLGATQAVLMVGTIEPRKAYLQSLSAFERLWAENVNASLVIVGKQGWTVEALIDRIRSHPELGKRLFWYDSLSDESLTRLYQASAGLLMASEGEGFGLPIVEAARHKLPVLARDLPVFREVAGEHAAYFSGLSPADLMDALNSWLSALKSGAAPRSDQLPWLTWQQSADQLARFINGDDWPIVWRPAAQKDGRPA
jgi:glycosyltransferase involved in cell wall biosynthesis